MTQGFDPKPLLKHLAAGARLDAAAAEAAFDAIMAGGFTDAQLGAFLMVLAQRGPDAAELTGGARALRARAAEIRVPDNAVDTCGTGGDGAGTLNISTAVAFVLAGAGVPVAKHGNRAVSSKSGSADVLAALGVAVDAGPETMAQAITEAGVGFLFAPAHHPAMRAVGPVRTELGMRTIFNCLGPLANPGGTVRQLVGVYDAGLVTPMAEALQALGARAAWVVHGAGGLDEVSLAGESQVAALMQGRITRFTVTPEDAGLGRAPVAALAGGDAAENATALRRLLDGIEGAYRDAVILNAAAALIVAERAHDLKSGARLAAEAIDSGRARGALDGLIAITQSAPRP